MSRPNPIIAASAEHRADIVKAVVEMRGDGLPLAAIVQQLNREGRKTFTGTAWSVSNLKRVLRRARQS